MVLAELHLFMLVLALRFNAHKPNLCKRHYCGYPKTLDHFIPSTCEPHYEYWLKLLNDRGIFRLGYSPERKLPSAIGSIHRHHSGTRHCGIGGRLCLSTNCFRAWDTLKPTLKQV